MKRELFVTTALFLAFGLYVMAINTDWRTVLDHGVFRAIHGAETQYTGQGSMTPHLPSDPAIPGDATNPALYWENIKRAWDWQARADFHEVTLTYEDVDRMLPLIQVVVPYMHDYFPDTWQGHNRIMWTLRQLVHADIVERTNTGEPLTVAKFEAAVDIATAINEYMDIDYDVLVAVDNEEENGNDAQS
jgi:hypothetical protein